MPLEPQACIVTAAPLAPHPPPPPTCACPPAPGVAAAAADRSGGHHAAARRGGGAARRRAAALRPALPAPAGWVVASRAVTLPRRGRTPAAVRCCTRALQGSWAPARLSCLAPCSLVLPVPSASGLPDLDKLTRKLEGGKISLQELCLLYRASSKLPHLAEAVRAHTGAHAPLLASRRAGREPGEGFRLTFCSSRCQVAAAPLPLPTCSCLSARAPFSPSLHQHPSGVSSSTHTCRFADALDFAHDPERLGKFEELLEAAVDMARVPDEYVISPTYDQVRTRPDWGLIDEGRALPLALPPPPLRPRPHARPSRAALACCALRRGWRTLTSRSGRRRRRSRSALRRRRATWAWCWTRPSSEGGRAGGACMRGGCHCHRGRACPCTSTGVARAGCPFLPADASPLVHHHVATPPPRQAGLAQDQQRTAALPAHHHQGGEGGARQAAGGVPGAGGEQGWRACVPPCLSVCCVRVRVKRRGAVAGLRGVAHAASVSHSRSLCFLSVPHRHPYHRRQVKKDGMKFLSKGLKAAAQRLQQLSGQYEARQAELLAQVRQEVWGRIGDGMQAEPACEPAPDPSQPRLWPQVVAVAVTFAEVWHGVAATLAELDVLAAFAEVASAAPAPYVRPTMLPSDGAGLWAGQAERVHAAVQLVPGSCACHHGSGSPHCLRPQPLPAAGEIVLRGCRHPCLEVQEGVAFIPNDCVMQAVRGRLCVHPGCQRASSICAAAAAHAIRLSSRPPAVPHPVPSLPAAHAHACAAGQVLVPHHHRPQHGRQVDLHPAGRPGRPHGAGDRAVHAVLGAPGTAWSVQAPLPLLMHAAAASRAASRERSVSLKAQCMAVAGGLLRARGRGAGERARRSVCARGCGRLPAEGPVHLHG